MSSRVSFFAAFRGVSLRLSLFGTVAAALCSPPAHAAPPIVPRAYTITFSDDGNGLTGTACLIGADRNDDGIITGDSGYYNFFSSGNDANEWWDARFTLYDDGVPFYDYHDVVGRKIRSSLFCVGLFPSSDSVFIGVQGDTEVANVFYNNLWPISGYSENAGHGFGRGYFSRFTVTDAPATIPEPGAWIFAAVASAALGVLGVRRKRVIE